MPKRSPTRLSSAVVAVALATATVACTTGRENRNIVRPTRPDPEAATTTAAAAPAVDGPSVRVVAAGDIACEPGMEPKPHQCQMEATATLVERLEPAVVLALGDLQYDHGELENFRRSYDASWGRFKDRTRPAVGNHEYAGGRAAGYFGYWGDQVNPPRGWYSFDLPEVGAHVVVINSVCSVVGCSEGSEQLEWLRDDLAANATAGCTIAAWHHPRHASGLHGEDRSIEPLWAAFSSGGGDVVLSGHDHHYERFAPQQGTRQFVVGTGGRNLYPVLERRPGSEFVDTRHFGVLELVVRNDSYSWRFHTIEGVVADEGQSDCR